MTLFKNSFNLSIWTWSLLAPFCTMGQFALTRSHEIPVTEQGDTLEMAWAGGLNFAQFSPIDLDLDGTLDLFVFDRIGSNGGKALTFINNGTTGQVDYSHDHTYESVWPFPELHDWVLMRDYDQDGKMDIFTYSLGGMAVYHNISSASLAFELVDDLIYSNYQPTVANLFVTAIDIPGLEDMDGDGDLDVLTFSLFGSYVEYHRNLSQEMYGHSDSLKFEIRNRCWGAFAENINNNSVTMDITCAGNVNNPEYPVLSRDDVFNERSSEDRAHVGSTLLPIDLDGNGVMDLILGDVSFNNLTALYNDGGITTSHIASQDTAFPMYDLPVDVQIFPGAFYLDVDNDGKRDLIVSPNNKSLSRNFTSVWYYKNNGTDAAPVFAFQQADLIQSQMIDLGEGAYPVPFDHNGDGLMDLVVADFGYFVPGGNYPCQFALFENVGTPTTPAFDLVTRDYMDLSTSGIGQAMYPAFGDVDGDGDKDLLIGDLQGKLHLFLNDPIANVANFTLAQANYTDALGTPIDVGQFAAPQFFDVSGDGLEDLLIGERNGNINYYLNVGNSSGYLFELENDSIGEVVVADQFNVTGYSVPFMYFNNAGERELLVGSESGRIYQYLDIDGNQNGTFNLWTDQFAGIDENMRTGVALVDINDDGYPDLFTGNYRGGLSFYRNDLGVGIADGSSTLNLQVYPNPATQQVNIVLPPELFNTEMSLIDLLGRTLRTFKTNNSGVLRIPTEDLPAGSYLLRSNGDHLLATARFQLIH